MKLKTPYENVWDAAKNVFREKVLALTTYNGKEVRFKSMTLASTLRKQKKKILNLNIN